MDALFAQPTQPASTPRVRAFAELALNEIRSGVDGDASLLADKQAFSEFMDRVNESVLLGRREPPSAASVLRNTQDYSQEGEEESGDLHVPSPDSDVSMASPASPVQSFDVNIGSKTGRSTAVATHLEALSSSLKLALSPRRHHRQPNDIADSGHAAQPQQPQSRPGAHRTRFDIRNDACNEDKGRGTGARPPEPLQYRKHGADGFEQQEEGLAREQNEDEDNEAPVLSSGHLAGPNLLQELRRWRSEATAETITDRNRRPVPPPPKASISGRPSPPLSWDSLSSQLHDTPSLSLTAVHRGARGVPSSRGTLGVSERANQVNAPVEPHEFRASVGRSWRGNGADGEPDGVTRSGTGEHRQTARRPTDSNDELSHRGTTPRAAQGSAPRTLPVSDRQLTGRRLSNRAEVTSAGRHWRDFDSNGHGKERPAGRREGVGGAKRTMEEGEQEEDDDDATELLLDLSDCSDEKLEAVLQRGRRVGSSRAGS